MEDMNKTEGNHRPNHTARGRFAPGNCANPNGRPKKDVSLTSLLKEEITKIPSGERQGRTWRQLLVLAWLTGAMKNPVLLKELLDRLEGRPTQIVTGAEGGPIKIEIQGLLEKLKRLENA